MILERNEITDIYDLVLKNRTQEYLMRYNNLPNEPEKWTWIDREVPRIIAVQEFEKYVQKYNIEPKKMLAFNACQGAAQDPELKFLIPERIVNFNYDDDPEKYDLHKIDIPDNDYDFVMLNQILEHLYNPFLCLEKIYEHLAEGAYFYCNVPTLNLIHGYPDNYITGFTPVGLGCLLKQTGFQVLEIGQWGNFEYIESVFFKNNWPFMGQCPTYNVFERPCQCWILAKK